MLGPETRQQLQQILVNLRQQILANRRYLDSAWLKLNEPEKELEEYARKLTMAQKIVMLEGIDQKRFHLIEAALEKMDAGEYGRCEDCGQPIAVKRLQALPWALCCVECASEQEKTLRSPATQSSSAPPPESMGDREILVAVRKEIAETEDMGDISVTCNNGVVYLVGLLPNEHSRRNLKETIEDVLGVEEIVDHTSIEQQNWPPMEPGAEDSVEPPLDKKTPEEILMNGEDVDDDILAALQEGTPIIPPSKFIPEKKP
ncbi:MAG: TraR/DksA C4-type zinc finger protein [Thermodesulfobacteriota bacterium]